MGIQILSTWWYWIFLILVLATGIFTPFAKANTTKSLTQSIFISAATQAIGTAAYIGVFLVTGFALSHPLVNKDSHPVSIFAVFPFAFVISLLIVPTLKTQSAKYLMKITSEEALKQLRLGNLCVFAFLWFCLWLFPF